MSLEDMVAVITKSQPNSKIVIFGNTIKISTDFSLGHGDNLNILITFAAFEYNFCTGKINETWYFSDNYQVYNNLTDCLDLFEQDDVHSLIVDTVTERQTIKYLGGELLSTAMSNHFNLSLSWFIQSIIEVHAVVKYRIMKKNK